MYLFAALAVAALGGLQAATPPIFNPGAPGAAPRTVSAAEAVEMSRTGFIEADVRFMQHMIVHHAQAVEMVALIDGRTDNRSVRLMGQRIGMSQDAEMEIMRGWLSGRGQPLTDPHAGHDMGGHGAHGHAGHGGALMAGMLTPEQMAALAAATGADFDRLFLEGMIQHHMGALSMVDDLLAVPDAAQDPLLSDFAAAVVGDQSAEIARMRRLLSEL